MKIYNIYDKAAKAFGRPMAFTSHGIARRSFHDAVNDPQTEYSKHPGDYSIHYIADYDEDTGALQPVSMELISEGLALVENESPGGSE